MADDDDSYEIDAQGQRVLIGLSAEETEEFIRLDAAISKTGPLLQITMDEWYNPQERMMHSTAASPG